MKISFTDSKILNSKFFTKRCVEITKSFGEKNFETALSGKGRVFGIKLLSNMIDIQYKERYIGSLHFTTYFKNKKAIIDLKKSTEKTVYMQEIINFL
jgi:hypothetical protein